MILNAEQLAKERYTQELTVFPDEMRVNLLDTIADLQRQLAERDAYYTAVAIMLGGRPGAAQNAVREDFPQLAEALDTYTQQRVDEALLAEANLAHEDNLSSGTRAEALVYSEKRLAAHRSRTEGKTEPRT